MPTPDLPPVAAVVVGVLVLFGALITVVGTYGLLRLKTFYDRIHPPTLGLTLGNASILLGSMVCFSVLGSRLVVHEVLILVFTILTTPVTMILLARAALFRDRSKAFDQQLAAEVLAAAKEEAARLEAAQAEAARHSEVGDGTDVEVNARAEADAEAERAGGPPTEA